MFFMNVRSFAFQLFIFRIHFFSLSFFSFIHSFLSSFLYPGEFFLSRPVGMDTTSSYDFDTTGSFDYDTTDSYDSYVDPSSTSLVLLPPPVSTSRVQVQSPVLLPPHDNSTYSFIQFRGDPEDEPFITTPDPTMSPPLSIQPWELLPLLQPPQPILVENAILDQPDQQQQQGNFSAIDNRLWLPAFELAFMNERSYENYVLLERPVHMELAVDLSPWDDSTLVFENL